MTSGGSVDMASGGSREAKKYHCKVAKLEWDVSDDYIQKLGQVGRGYHSRGLQRLQCNMWISFTLIVCSQNLVTRYIVGPSLTMGGLAIQVLHQWQQQTVIFSLCKQRGTQL